MHEERPSVHKPAAQGIAFKKVRACAKNSIGFDNFDLFAIAVIYRLPRFGAGMMTESMVSVIMPSPPA